MSCEKQDIYTNDTGTVFKLTIVDFDTKVALDLSVDTSIKKITFKSPDGTVATQTAVFDSDGSDGVINYTTIAGDIDVSGTWSIQGYIEGTGFANSSEIGSFTVVDPL